MTVICEFCGASLCDKYNLKRHQKQAKKCLSLQEIANRKKTYDELEEELRLLKINTKLKELKVKSKKLDEKTTHQTINIYGDVNTVINNMLPLTNAHIKEANQYLTIDHIDEESDGCGYIKHVVENSLKDRVAVTNVKEKKIVFKDSDNKVVLDVGGYSLLKKISALDSDKWTELIDNERDKLRKKKKKTKDLGKLKIYTEQIVEYNKKEANLTKLSTGVECKFAEKASKTLIKRIVSKPSDQLLDDLKK